MMAAERLVLAMHERRENRRKSSAGWKTRTLTEDGQGGRICKLGEIVSARGVVGYDGIPLPLPDMARSGRSRRL